MASVRKAVIPAAGFGTRFLPQTKAMPKEMLPLIDKPIIQYLVEQLVAAGIRDIIIVTGQNKRSIEDHFDSPTQDLLTNLKLGGDKKLPLIEEVEAIADIANFIYVRQKGPYGNGTPLLNVEHLIGDEPFIYVWSDDLVISEPPMYQQMIEAYTQYYGLVTCCMRMKDEDSFKKYGFVGGKQLRPGIVDVDAIKEKPGSKAQSPSDLAQIAGFVVTPDIFKYLRQAYDNLKEGDELYFNDALNLMLADHRRVIAMEFQNGTRYDTGDKLEYLKTVVDFALNNEEVAKPFRDYLRTKLK
ncbi:MAG TPA: UTP--glucose-1-phosphate uridylyltransferase [Candidatus Saccharimonadales bacterium]|nr:UTP--glucose-1-phosphate uridylyltransferase [Candidatus Saccharimonadales bacterium]